MLKTNMNVPDALLLAIAAVTLTASGNQATFDIGQGQTFNEFPSFCRIAISILSPTLWPN
jgi:hypothetical protein